MANVSIRLSVQDAEVVRTALQNIGKDGEAALNRIASAQAAAGVPKGLANFVDELRSKVVGLAVPLGPLGSLLVALGPAGTAAAVGIGAAVAIMTVAVERANAFGDAMKNLNERAEASGLAATQLQALSDAGARFGLDAQQTSTFVEKLTINLDQLRQGGGPLFDQLSRIDIGLVRQLASTKSTAEAWDILARAIQSTTDAAQRNALSRAIGGGRGSTGAAGGLLLDYTAQQGGLQNLVAQTAAAGAAIDDNMVKRIAALKTEIDATNARAKLMIDSLYSEEILQKELRAAEAWERIAKAAKDYSELTFGQKLLDYVLQVGSGLAEGAGQGSGLTADEIAAMAARNRLASGLAGGQQWDGQAWSPSAPAQPKPGGTGTVSAAVSLALMEKWTSVLGSAITPTEALNLEIAKLNAAQEKGGVSDAIRARALAALNLAQDQARVTTRERFGLASQEEIIAVGLRNLEDLRAKGYITNAEDMAAAERVVQKEAKAAYEAEQVRAAALPNLKQFELDATDLNKALDTTATQGVNDLTTALVDFELGNKTAAQSAKDLGLAVLTSIDQMIIKMTIAAPIARALQQIIGGFLPGGSGGFVGSTGDANNYALASANGNAFGAGGVSMFGDGGAFTNGIYSRPTFFRFASGGMFGLGVMGEKTDEAVMPLTRGAGGKLGVAANVPNIALNVAPQINISVDSRNNSGVTVGKASPNQSGGLDISMIVDDLDAALADRIGSGRSATGKVIATNFGLARKFQ